MATSTGGHLKNGYFEPLDNVKGDVARICLYVYVRYGSEYSKCNNITNVFESVDVLLEWCEMDPVDTWEMSRNDVVESVQGNRNVFIDYPEYAWLLFGEDVPNSMETPSGEAKKAMPSEKPSDNENETTAPETTAPETDAPESDVADKETEVKEETKKETKKDNNNAADNSKEDSGCGSTITISAICIVGIVGIMTVVKKKED
ncbi:MAG: hypothetical protein E7678_07265 [Ruminococcaceae bacterium]|nr:hypothetical protein [Oscillospiraceae bacterium]